MRVKDVKNVEQQVKISGFPLIQFIHWDECSNPFDRAEASAETSHDRTALALNELFRQQFSHLFLNGPTPSSAAHTQSQEQKPTFAEAEEIVPRWTLRLQKLHKLCRSGTAPDRAVLRRFRLSEALASHLPPTLPLQVWIHPRFQRMFTAVAERPRLFCASSGPLDVFDAARVAHECAHILSGHSLGWRLFQQLPALQLEEPAIRAEHQFLVDVVGETSWSHAALRLAWNEISSAEHLQVLRQFAKCNLSSSIDAQKSPGAHDQISESCLYLQLIDTVDPL